MAFEKEKNDKMAKTNFFPARVEPVKGRKWTVKFVSQKTTII